MKIVFVFLLLLLSLSHVEGSVTVTFKILAASNGNFPSSATVVSALASILKNNTLKYPSPVLNYTVGNYSMTSGSQMPTEQGSSSSVIGQGESAGSNVVSSAVLLFITLLSFASSKRAAVAFVMAFALITMTQRVEALNGTYTNCKLLDSSLNYQLHWSVDGTNVRFAMQAQTAGWIAMGISQNGRMDSGGAAPGSDIFMGYIGTGCQKGCINDYSTSVYDLPKLDTTQNLQFVSASSVGGYLTIEFTRALNTGDKLQDTILNVNSDMYLIWSVNTMSPPVDNSTFAKHNFRDSAVINLSAASKCPTGNGDIEVQITFDEPLAAFDADAFTSAISSQLGIDNYRVVVTDVKETLPPFCPTCDIIEFKFPHYAIPATPTTYACMGFLFPSEVGHIIKFEVVVDNPQVLHHIVLYQLPAGSAPFPGNPQLCNMPASALPMFAWAPGGEAVVLPDAAGFRVGGNSGIKYAVLNMHYNNPTSASGLFDSSSVRMYVTRNLRQFDAGFMFLGNSIRSIAIPPNSPHWHMAGTCGRAATQGLGTTVMNVFASMVHMHYSGRKQWVEHYRNGVLMGGLGDNLNYDFNSQKFVPVNTTIQAGDSLVTHCVWETLDRNYTVYGGEESTQEMCLHALLYYPNLDVGGCVSSQTGGCNCDYGQACLTTPQCTDDPTACSSHSDCASCSSDASCGWCDSKNIQSCLPANLAGGCQNIGGAWNACAQNTGTPCTQSHSDCASCNADTTNNCSWCFFPLADGDSMCLANSRLINATTICQALNGVSRPQASQC